MEIPLLVITWVLGVAVFVPLLVIALIRFESKTIAFVVAASFTMGAMAGFFLSALLASYILPRAFMDDYYLVLFFVFASAGAIGGAALALRLLRRISGTQAWRRR